MDKNDKSCETNACDMKKCCPVRGFVLPAIAVYVTIFVFEWVFHGTFMKASYEATASLWRPEAEMQSMFYVCITRQIVMALVITALYFCSKGFCADMLCRASRLKKGLKFGFLIGLLLGISQFGAYAYLPIPVSLALSWLGGEIVLGILIGLVLSLGCCLMKKNATKA